MYDNPQDLIDHANELLDFWTANEDEEMINFLQAVIAKLEGGE